MTKTLAPYLLVHPAVFECPSRGLIGFRSQFATITRGTGVLHRAFARCVGRESVTRCWDAWGREGAARGDLVAAGLHPSP